MIVWVQAGSERVTPGSAVGSDMGPVNNCYQTFFFSALILARSKKEMLITSGFVFNNAPLEAGQC